MVQLGEQSGSRGERSETEMSGADRQVQSLNNCLSYRGGAQHLPK